LWSRREKSHGGDNPDGANRTGPGIGKFFEAESGPRPYHFNDLTVTVTIFCKPPRFSLADMDEELY
jgi:hypothetical protein